MKCTCSRADLNAALQAVSKAVAVKSATPILAGIYMLATGNNLELQATNFQLSVIAKIPANVESEGAIVVPGQTIPEIVRKLGGEIVTISNDNDTTAAVIKSDAAAFTIPTMEAEDFPKINPDNPLTSFRIQLPALKNLINHTVFACSKDESRPAFTGCNVEISGTDIKFAATNTHRIAIAKEKIFDEISEPLNFIIPASTLYNIRSMLAISNDSIITIDYSGNDVAFRFDNFFVSSRLIDGTFPPYERAIPPSCATVAELNVADFTAAVDRISIISKSTEYNSILFKFTHDGLEISSSALDVGNGVEHVDVELEGPDLEIAFNFNYIMDVLKIAASKNIKVGMNQTLTPIDVREIGNDDFIYIVTPVRTK